MANLALNVNVKWRVILALLVVVFLIAVYFLPSFKPRISAGGANGKNVQEAYLSWDGKEQAIFYRQVLPTSPPAITVLLLHGARFTSKNWLQTGTVETLGSKGYRVVAVDLPGYGNSGSVEQPSDEKENGKAKFLHTLIDRLNLDRPVVVSPSMSGSYALPFVIEHTNEVRGFVPIAPHVGQDIAEDLKTLNLPTLIVYGEKDKGHKEDVERLRTIPQSEEFQMERVGHACYIENPDGFNARLEQFLKKLV